MNRVSLFEELKKGGYESALITTYNIDFPFYEDVVLRRMQSAGIDHHIVMVDSGMCAQAVSSRPPVKSGYHYSLAPMKCPAAFHPKLLLMVGKDKGFLAVGSHNLTLSGYGNNLEITNVVRYHRKTAPETLPIFQSAFAACRTWMNDYGVDLPEGITESFSKILGACEWLDVPPVADLEDIRFAYTSRTTASMWDQVVPSVPKDPAAIFGMSAFFDRSLSFIKVLSGLNPEKFQLGVQSATVSAPQELLNLDAIDVMDSESIIGEAGRSYIHAKLLYLYSEDTPMLVSGSANLSYPAWMANGDSANAEAVLLQSGSRARESYQLLGFGELDGADSVESIPSMDDDKDVDTTIATPLTVVNYDLNGELMIPWEQPVDDLVVGYMTGMSSLDAIEFVFREDSLYVNGDNLRKGEVLHIQQGGATLAYVIVHHEQRIREYSSTGTERKLRHALGSLNTSSPELSTLFSCVGRLMLEDKGRGSKSVATNRTKGDSKLPDAPESLISNLRDCTRNKVSGRLSLTSGGDIGLIMSTLLSSLAVDHSTSAIGLNEDRLGRNEEELVGQDDGVSSDVADESASISNDEVKEIIQRKLKSTVTKLDEYLSVHGLEACHAALGVSIFAHHLKRTKDEYVDKELLEKLFAVIARRLLSDKAPISLIDSEDDDPYKSDDWGRLLGYVVWLGYHSGIVMRNRLPLSASKEEKDLQVWRNAGWLYLSQRVVADEHVQAMAGELVTESRSDKMQQWFAALLNTGRSLDQGECKIISDFHLARSPNGKAFQGYRVVSGESTNQLQLASVSGIGVTSSFATGFLDVISCYID